MAASEQGSIDALPDDTVEILRGKRLVTVFL